MTDKQMVQAVKEIVKHCEATGRDDGTCPGCVFARDMDKGTGGCFFLIDVGDWRMDIVKDRG